MLVGIRHMHAAAACMLAVLALSCHARPRAVLGPAGPEVPEELIQSYVAQGDESFQAMHLHEWRLAEAAYTKAYQLASRREIRDKLALTKVVRMTREIDEDIPCPNARADVDFVCKDIDGPRGQAYCDLAQAYLVSPAEAAEQMKRVDPAVFQVDSSPLDAYFFMLYARTLGADAKTDELRKQLSEKYKGTPLFAYLNVFAGESTWQRMTQQSPDFAEAWETGGESALQAKAIKPTRTNFAKAVELIPDYTRALNGLANVYFFLLEDYVDALKGYEAALKWDAQNTAALFGKGACLHHLEMYAQSNETMDKMLATDISRNGRVGRNSVQYYRGEANYYKAFNYHLMNDPAKARQLVDEAKRDLPQAQEINYLSGLLYYYEDKFDAATAGFQDALKQGNHCYAYYYLGMIDIKQAKPAAATMFATAGSCLESGVRNYQASMRSLLGQDLEPAEKQALQAAMRQKLVGYRDSSADLIRRMIGLVQDSEIDINWRSTFTDSMNALLLKVQSVNPN